MVPERVKNFSSPICITSLRGGMTVVLKEYSFSRIFRSFPTVVVPAVLKVHTWLRSMAEGL